MTQQDLVCRLIEFSSQNMDLELAYQCPAVKRLLSDYSQSSTIEEENSMDMICQEQIKGHGDCSTPESFKESEPVEDSHSKSQGHRSLKRKRIMKSNAPSYDQFDSESEDYLKKPKDRKKKAKKQIGYPTKNFLPNFKTPHIKFLEEELGVEFVQRFEIVGIIKDKDGIAMKDYENLYNTAEFADAFEKFFKNKVLYRELMLSRSSLKARHIHVRKIGVFQKAYKEKNFNRIN